MHVHTYLCSQVRDDDKLLQDILGKDVGVARLLDVVRGDIDVIGSQVEVGGRDCPHTPLRSRRESRPLIVAGGSDDDLVPVFVDGACGGGRQLALFLGLLLDLCDLLPLLRGSTDLHAQDDVPDLGLCQGGHIHTGGGERGSLLGMPS